MAGSRTEQYKTVRRYDIPGHAHFITFSCYKRLPLLGDERFLSFLGQSVHRACTELHYDLWAYVFMPEHVHLLVKPLQDSYSIAELLRKIKQPSAMRSLNVLKKERSAVLEQLALSPTQNGKSRFWQAGGGHDLNIWTPSKAVEKAEYCHRNPVVRGLVSDPAAWQWSSYRWLEQGSREGEPLGVNTWGLL